jgi:WD40 repeat protein
MQHEDRIRDLAVLTDGRIVSGSSDGMVRIWEPATGEVKLLVKNEGAVVALTILPDARLAMASEWSVRIYDPATGLISHLDQAAEE